MEFHQLYRPLTASPFRNSALYRELLPCPALRPWVRCFWGTDRHRPEIGTLVTPDTCMDLILEIPQDGAPVTGCFCGINDRAFVTPGSAGAQSSTFAVRFYPWAAALFADAPLTDSKNLICPAQQLFPRLYRALAPRMQACTTLAGRAGEAEQILLSSLQPDRSGETVLQASWEMLCRRGSIDQLSRSLHISTRQLERLFQSRIGLPPKALACLIRYQLLWRDALQPGFDVQDAVFRYGYTDQAHLLRDFKRFHTMTIPQALAYARKDVGFLQEIPEFLP